MHYVTVMLLGLCFYGIKNLAKKILKEVDVRLAKHCAVVKKEIVLLESKRF